MRDYVAVTDQRLIAANVQGMTGTRKEFTSVLSSKMLTHSVETAGRFDLDAELDLWFCGRQSCGWSSGSCGHPAARAVLPALRHEAWSGSFDTSSRLGLK
jgi:hypothetical protein